MSFDEGVMEYSKNMFIRGKQYHEHRHTYLNILHFLCDSSAQSQILTNSGRKVVTAVSANRNISVNGSANDKQFLARSAVMAPRDIRKPAIGHVQPIYKLIAKGTRGLNNSSTHEDNIC